MAPAEPHTAAVDSTERQLKARPISDRAEDLPPEDDKPFNPAALLSLTLVSKPVKTGRQKGSLIRSSLPNMPLRDIVTPQRPLPPGLNMGPQKMRKPRSTKHSQPSRSGSSQQESANGAEARKDTACTAAPQLSTTETSVLMSSDCAPANSTAKSLPDAAMPDISSSLQLGHASHADTDRGFYTAGSVVAPDSPGISAASEKAKLWELVEQLERQLR